MKTIWQTADGLPPAKKPRSTAHDPQHGTLTRYYKGCRCDECKAALSERNKRDRLRRKAREAAHDAG